MPKYIPNDTFIDVVLNVLTSDKILEVLEKPAATTTNSVTQSFWNRFSAAIGVVEGVSGRITDPALNKRLADAVGCVEASVEAAKTTTVDASTFLGELEMRTSQLRRWPRSATRRSGPPGATDRLDPAPAPRPERESGDAPAPGDAIGRMAESSIKTALTSCLNQAGADLDAFKRRVGVLVQRRDGPRLGLVQAQYPGDPAPDRRVLCVLNNVDTVKIVRALSASPELRASVAKWAEGVAKRGPNAQDAKDPDALRKDLQATSLPLWWSRDEFQRWWGVDPPPNPTASGWAADLGRLPMKLLGLLISTKFLGMVISTMAVSMGAPFWFDVLNKLVNVRLVGKRPDTGDAGSSDSKDSRKGK